VVEAWWRGVVVVRWGNGVAPQGYEDFMDTSVHCKESTAEMVRGINWQFDFAVESP